MLSTSKKLNFMQAIHAMYRYKLTCSLVLVNIDSNDLPDCTEVTSLVSQELSCHNSSVDVIEGVFEFFLVVGFTDPFITVSLS